MRSGLAARVNDDPPHTVAVATRLYASDDRVHECVLDILGDGMSEILLWGEDCPADLDFRIGTVEHRLSSAARAFKRHALAAAALSTEALDDTGTFRSGVSLKYPVGGVSISR